MKAWKGVDEEGLKWLIELFNVIFMTTKVPYEWILSRVIPLYKKKRWYSKLQQLPRYKAAEPQYEVVEMSGQKRRSRKDN